MNKEIVKNRKIGNTGALLELPHKAYRLLLALLWVQNTAYTFFYRVAIRLPIVYLIADIILPTLIVILLVGAAPYIVKKTRFTEVALYIALLVAYLLSMVFGADAVSTALSNEWFRVLISVMPFIFVGVCLDLEENGKMLYYLSLVSVLAMILFQVYSLAIANSTVEDNMSPAYYSLPSVAYLICYAFEKPRIFNWVAVAFGVGLLFTYGTRGPVLCVTLLAAGLLVYKVMTVKSLPLRATLIVALGVALYGLLFTDFIYDMFVWLSDLFSGMGVSTRIFDMAIEENLLEDSGRGKIATDVLAGVKESMLVGHGVMGDRKFTPHYAHNMLYEMWCSFGIIVGTVVFGALMLLVIYAFAKTKTAKERAFLWMLFSITVVKLFMSSSYLYEPYLFLMVGYAISLVRKYGKSSGAALKNGGTEE